MDIPENGCKIYLTIIVTRDVWNIVWQTPVAESIGLKSCWKVEGPKSVLFIFF